MRLGLSVCLALSVVEISYVLSFVFYYYLFDCLVSVKGRWRNHRNMYKEIYILLTNTQDYIFVIFVIGYDPQTNLFASATFLIVFFCCWNMFLKTIIARALPLNWYSLYVVDRLVRVGVWRVYYYTATRVGRFSRRFKSRWLTIYDFNREILQSIFKR